MEKIFEHMVQNKLINKDLKYEFYRVSGDKYGNPITGTKKWDGLIGELIEHVCTYQIDMKFLLINKDYIVSIF